MALEALKEIKDLSKQEIIAKMKSGDFVPPSKGAERAEFFNFVGMTKEEREAHLSKVSQPSETTDKGVQPPASPAAPATEPPKPTDKPLEPSAPPAPTDGPSAPVVPPAAPAPAPSGSPEPWWKVAGYESEQQAAEAHKNLLDVSARLQDQLDNVNSREGKRGQELKRLKEENDKLLNELAGLKGSAPALQKPVRPKRPNPKDFPDGALDATYHEAIEKFEADYDVYETKKEIFDRETIRREVLKDIPAPVAAAPVEDSVQGAWNKMWESDIPEFQKRMNLTTTVPIKRISDCFAAADPQNTNISPADRELAKSFLMSLPQSDREAYAKVKKAVEKTYDFSTGVPQSQYRSIEGALFDQGLLGDNSFVKPVPVPMRRDEADEARRRQQDKNAQAAVPVPASASAAADPSLSAPSGKEEMGQSYRGLLQKYNRALQQPSTRKSFESSDDYRELIRLQKELGLTSRAIV